MSARVGRRVPSVGWQIPFHAAASIERFMAPCRYRRAGENEQQGPTNAESEAESIADEDLQDRIVEAAARAVREAVRDHKRAGNPIAVLRDGKVVLVPPEEIED